MGKLEKPGSEGPVVDVERFTWSGIGRLMEVIGVKLDTQLDIDRNLGYIPDPIYPTREAKTGQ